ncbi:hypothetical protein A6V39_01220 [Candidatus Mycoplasma haematobovis]|uniref:Uncharacterized protein n=1 Tax=Candidatus Mycoplasma haematobovis TaxID=432608 RepID=A0A1A9QEW3_9MOLU|nr:hypothetical protein [Candidatus Mycoplasma haematobovis]OAL10674.1 hypothetical protein A6V39_01220 [Candidatus Mycoplasma haematobovis]
MKTSSITSIIAACLSAGGAVVGYIFLRPKNLGEYLKWQGLTLASTDNDALWQSIYEENQEHFKTLFPNEEGDEKWRRIKKYCSEAIPKADYDNNGIENAKKLCVDNVKTVKGQMIKNKLKVDDMMTEEAQFKTAAAVQGNDKFWGLIGATNDTLEERAKAYQRWCTESLNSQPKDDLVKNVDSFCHKKSYSNFSEKLLHDGYVRLSDEDIDAQYTTLKVDQLQKNTGSNWLEAIGGGSDKWVTSFDLRADTWKITKEKFVENYKKYCEAGDKLTLFDEGNYLKKYSEYRGICAKEGPNVKKNEN